MNINELVETLYNKNRKSEFEIPRESTILTYHICWSISFCIQAKAEYSRKKEKVTKLHLWMALLIKMTLKSIQQSNQCQTSVIRRVIRGHVYEQ